MFTRNNVRSKITFEKDLVNDQTFTGLTVKMNTTNRTFDVAEGLGQAAAVSTLVFAHVGGFKDQKVVATMKYVSPSTNIDHEFGVLARVQTLDNSADEDYYYARVDDGVAKLTKVVAGTFTNLSTSVFPLPIDTSVTITLQIVGNALTATFDADDVISTVILSATDSDITESGLCGFRTRSAAGWCSYIAVEEL